MIPLSVPEIEGGSPERDGGGEGEEEEEGLVWADSSSWDGDFLNKTNFKKKLEKCKMRILCSAGF